MTDVGAGEEVFSDAGRTDEEAAACAIREGAELGVAVIDSYLA